MTSMTIPKLGQTVVSELYGECAVIAVSGTGVSVDRSLRMRDDRTIVTVKDKKGKKIELWWELAAKVWKRWPEDYPNYGSDHPEDYDGECVCNDCLSCAELLNDD